MLQQFLQAVEGLAIGDPSSPCLAQQVAAAGGVAELIQ